MLSLTPSERPDELEDMMRFFEEVEEHNGGRHVPGDSSDADLAQEVNSAKIIQSC